MNTQAQIKEVRATILKGDCSFTIGGITNYQKLEDGTYGYAPQVFKVNDMVSYIYEANTIGAIAQQMNIDKITRQNIHLYSFGMLKNKIVGKINFEDIKIITKK